MPTEDTQIKLFKNKKVRSIWDKESEEWYFSVVDVVEVLTESANLNNYWKVLKKRLKKEGKMYKTDCLDTQCIFRKAQSECWQKKALPTTRWGFSKKATRCRLEFS